MSEKTAFEILCRVISTQAVKKFVDKFSSAEFLKELLENSILGSRTKKINEIGKEEHSSPSKKESSLILSETRRLWQSDTGVKATTQENAIESQSQQPNYERAVSENSSLDSSKQKRYSGKKRKTLDLTGYSSRKAKRRESCFFWRSPRFWKDIHGIGGPLFGNGGPPFA